MLLRAGKIGVVELIVHPELRERLSKWHSSHLGAATAPGRANKMRKPTSCVNEGEHPARFRVWIKNGSPESVSSTFTCFVPMIDWDRRWRKFENGDEPICVCEDAAREMGIVR